ncbi:hypothetical protein D3C80_1833160 [compost metagenome]
MCTMTSSRSSRTQSLSPLPSSPNGRTPWALTISRTFSSIAPIWRFEVPVAMIMKSVMLCLSRTSMTRMSWALTSSRAATATLTRSSPLIISCLLI